MRALKVREETLRALSGRVDLNDRFPGAARPAGSLAPGYLLPRFQRTYAARPHFTESIHRVAERP